MESLGETFSTSPDDLQTRPLSLGLLPNSNDLDATPGDESYATHVPLPTERTSVPDILHAPSATERLKFPIDSEVTSADAMCSSGKATPLRFWFSSLTVNSAGQAHAGDASLDREVHGITLGDSLGRPTVLETDQNSGWMFHQSWQHLHNQIYQGQTLDSIPELTKDASHLAAAHSTNARHHALRPPPTPSTFIGILDGSQEFPVLSDSGSGFVAPREVHQRDSIVAKAYRRIQSTRHPIPNSPSRPTPLRHRSGPPNDGRRGSSRALAHPRGEHLEPPTPPCSHGNGSKWSLPSGFSGSTSTSGLSVRTPSTDSLAMSHGSPCVSRPPTPPSAVAEYGDGDEFPPAVPGTGILSPMTLGSPTLPMATKLYAYGAAAASQDSPAAMVDCTCCKPRKRIFADKLP